MVLKNRHPLQMWHTSAFVVALVLLIVGVVMFAMNCVSAVRSRVSAGCFVNNFTPLMVILVSSVAVAVFLHRRR